LTVGGWPESSSRRSVTMTYYTADFYRKHRDGARYSAETIVPIVLDLVQPRSVIDVGCGLGAWLAVFRDNGVEDVWGMDGPHVDARLLEIAQSGSSRPTSASRSGSRGASTSWSRSRSPSTFLRTVRRLSSSH
jgi:hypothetical protein